MIGRIVKGIGGYYFVSSDQTTYMGKARGNLKKNKEVLVVGDIVEFTLDNNNECVVNKIIERKNFLRRPPVSNLDMMVVVFSIVKPDVNLPVIDKLIASCEYIGINVVICISKTDLVSENELNEIKSIYEKIYPVITIDNHSDEFSDEHLRNIIKGHSVALAGPSGVGKSTIINRLKSEANAKIGSISDKTDRGRHTTRHVEIFDIGDNTFLFDTPGFTSLELGLNDNANIDSLFPEIRKLSGNCKYRNCKHINEPDCAVKKALENGQLSQSRYNSYLIITEEVSK